MDNSGNAYITGLTTSWNYPTYRYYQRTYGGGSSDAFVSRLNANGSQLLYSTYIGGQYRDHGNGIAVDNSGNAYIAGEAQPRDGNCFNCPEADFPTKNAFQRYSSGWADALLAKFNTNASGNQSLLFSTYMGGDNGEGAYGIALDSTGNSYLAGVSWSDNFPTTPGVFQRYSPGYQDAFVAKFSSSGSRVYATYLGGEGTSYETGRDVGLGIAVDSSNNVYVTGQTISSSFPVTSSFQSTKHGAYDAFVAKLNSTGSSLLFGTYLGGSSDDYGHAISLDGSSNIYVAGQAGSTDFPVADAYQGTKLGPNDAFAAKLSASGSSLLYSTYLGGSGSDGASDIAVNSFGDAYVAGTTGSTNFPTTPGAFQTAGDSGDSAFVAKLTENSTKANECLGGGNPVIYTTQPVGCGDPVDTATGNYWASYIDLSILGRGVPLMFSRTYNSLDAWGNQHSHQYPWLWVDPFVQHVHRQGRSEQLPGTPGERLGGSLPLGLHGSAPCDGQPRQHQWTTPLHSSARPRQVLLPEHRSAQPLQADEYRGP